MTETNSTARPRLFLLRGKEKALFRRHPWVFSGAFHHVEGNPQEGDVVDIVDADGRWMAVGHYQKDNIMVKVLRFDAPEVDESFWRSRVSQALRYRQSMGFFSLRDTNVFRLINGEGDFLPGLIADYYNGVVVLQAHSVGMHRLFPTFVHILSEVLPSYAPLQAVFDKSSATLPVDPSQPDGYRFGIEPDEWEISENGVRMLINFYEGQKTGFFVDQRDNRRLVGSLAEGRRVLNCFGYTGGFSLAALQGGASYVETVDISKKAVSLCERNVQRNFPSAPHRGVAADALKYLDTLQDNFDLIVLDPPAFAKNHKSLQQGLRGYRNINQKALEHIAHGGYLFTFSCSQAVSKEAFQTMIFTSSANARRQVRIVRTLPHAADHPVSVYHPEGEYLKGLLLYVE